MPSIIANSNDNTAYAIAGTWAGVRDATGGNVSSFWASTGTLSLVNRVMYHSGRGNYFLHRWFMWFDTSGITSTPSSANISLTVTGAGSGDSIIIKSTAFGGDGLSALATGDYDAFPGFSTGASMSGNVTDYSNNVTNNAANPLVYTLNSDALSDMTSNNYLIVCVVNYSFDYLNVSSGLPSTNSHDLGIRTADYSTASERPTLNYTTAGYSNDIIGVASANVGRVKGITSAAISKIIGV
jgi:hypothetical protein